MGYRRANRLLKFNRQVLRKGVFVYEGFKIESGLYTD